MNLTPNVHDVQFPDIAITGNGNVYVTFRQFAAQGGQSRRRRLREVDRRRQDLRQPQDRHDVHALRRRRTRTRTAPSPATAATSPTRCSRATRSSARDTQVRSTADQPRTTSTCTSSTTRRSPAPRSTRGTTYGSVAPGIGSQSGVYFIRLNGATGAATAPKLIDDQRGRPPALPGHRGLGQQAGRASGGTAATIPSYSPARPVGNDAAGMTGPSLDVYSARSGDRGTTWSATATRLTDVTSNPNYEQFDDRTVPFAGDYLWVSMVGSTTFGTWTDWRNTVAGTDPREAAATTTTAPTSSRSGRSTRPRAPGRATRPRTTAASTRTSTGAGSRDVLVRREGAEGGLLPDDTAAEGGGATRPPRRDRGRDGC